MKIETINDIMFDVIPPLYRRVESDHKELIADLGNKSLYIYGGVGVGKTQLTAQAVKDILSKNDCNVSWEKGVELWFHIKSILRTSSVNIFEKVMNITENPNPIVIDDIGFVIKEQLFELILKYRLQNGFQTLTNALLTPTELEKESPIIWEIISNNYKVIKLDGKDRRLERK